MSKQVYFILFTSIYLFTFYKQFYKFQVTEWQWYPDYSIIKIGPITKKNPGDLRRLAVT